MKSRIRIAVSARVIVATIRKRTGTGESLHAIPRIPDPTVFGKTPLNQPPDTSVPHIQPDGPDKRLNLFGYQWDTTDIPVLFSPLISGMGGPFRESCQPLKVNSRIRVYNPIFRVFSLNFMV